MSHFWEVQLHHRGIKHKVTIPWLSSPCDLRSWPPKENGTSLLFLPHSFWTEIQLQLVGKHDNMGVEEVIRLAIQVDECLHFC